MQQAPCRSTMHLHLIADSSSRYALLELKLLCVPLLTGASPVPRCQPLRSLQELLDWQPPHLPHFQSYNAPLPVRPPPSPGAPAARHGHGQATGHSIMSAPSPQWVTREVSF